MLVVHVKKHKYDVYVGRPTEYGNPFSVDKYGRERCIEMYEDWITGYLRKPLRDKMKRELYSKVLACWCAQEPIEHTQDPVICHAQIIARIANE